MPGAGTGPGGSIGAPGIGGIGLGGADSACGGVLRLGGTANVVRWRFAGALFAMPGTPPSMGSAGR